ncbi:GDSL-type esterase/lipase family protein [Sphingomonas desiccabilis]|uniref:Lysophospholipase n=1 Tax=Sphingomonas desiccabilis TaxID=429134 RepID=A0A4Q2IYX8_9SPHN|nr:GDSL-type esterase/lipase family protein [Sphingomonas desiccabilis]MBB3912704.1 lysophospholipase L1-like esterase [Sphingomonas desiccabilis]RXZ34668.1 lysophospholipase [Sphingomonas desiccabilis]
MRRGTDVSPGKPRARGFHLLAAAAAILATSSDAAPHAAQTAPKPIKLILAGDSTIAQGTGWGGAFCASHVASLVACVPIGRGGRSSASYRAEGSWQLALGELAVPGYGARYVMIAFGANDLSHDSAIGTTPQAFAANLMRFVAQVRAAGGEPILLTPLATRGFRDGKLADTMAPSAAKVREVAARTGTPLIELDLLSGAFYQKMGPAAALGFELRPPSAAELRAAATGTTLPPGNASRRDYTADYIHLNSRGAAAIAGLIAPRLVAAVPALRTYVKP